jgi:hypothetical protein
MDDPLSVEALSRTFADAVLGRHTDSLDILHFAKIDAALSSARYYCEHAARASNFEDDVALLQFALSQVSLDGLYCEFGVASGRTINWIAQTRPQATIHGFDSFAGLPEDWRTDFHAGMFKQEQRPKVQRNVVLHEGLFDQSLPAFCGAHAGNIAFLHVDCDLYSSTKTVLSHLAPRLRKGTIVVFDEYWNFPGWQHGEFRAWQECVAQRAIAFEYIGFVSRHQQVAVRVTAV